MNESENQNVKKNRRVSSLVIWMEEISAPVDIYIYMVNIPLFTRIYTSQVHDFFHQQYHFQKRNAKSFLVKTQQVSLKVNGQRRGNLRCLLSSEVGGICSKNQRKLGSFGGLGYL